LRNRREVNPRGPGKTARLVLAFVFVAAIMLVVIIIAAGAAAHH
jgi:hypothetical protein